MIPFAELNLAEKAARVEERLRRAPVWVFGPPGSGRSELASELSKRIPTVLVEPPGQDEVDAPIHALSQCAQTPDEVALAFDEKHPLEYRARGLAAALESKGQTLVVRVPGSWRFTTEQRSADRQRRERDTFAIIQGWLSGSKQVVLLTNTRDDVDALARRFDSQQAIGLPRVTIRSGALLEAERWGPYLGAAQEVQRALENATARLTPLQVRLLVGVVALGGDAARLVRMVQDQDFASDLVPLVGRLKSQVQRHHPGLWPRLLVIARARFPLRREDVLSLAELSGEHAPLLPQCVGYGDELIRIPETVRDALLDNTDDQTDAHQRLALQYQRRDGALAPLELSGEQLKTWLEKTHHLAQVPASTLVGLQKWEALSHPSRFLLWDRARTLSRVYHRYADAASLFKRALDEFGPNDDYSWHYYAFNRQRDGHADRETEAAYRQAVSPALQSGEANPGHPNPWWNARLVTYLITGGKEEAAQRAWSAALEAIDPERQRVKESPWLSLHFHQWVVRAWLDVGNVARAREAFGLIPEHFGLTELKLKELKWRLEDAEEAELLAESVYPVNVDPARRWRQPQGEADDVTGWAPGRVVSADKNGVVVVMAEMREGKPVKRVVRTKFTAKQWLALTGARAQQAHGFFELQVRNTKQQVVMIPAAPPEWSSTQLDELTFMDDLDA